MSGAEIPIVVGIAASVLQVFDACSKTVSRFKQFLNNKAFDDLSIQLDLFERSLEELERLTEMECSGTPAEQSLARVLAACRQELEVLKRLIQNVLPGPCSSKLGNTVKGLKGIIKEGDIRKAVEALEGYKSAIGVHLAWRGTRNIPTADSYFEVPVQFVAKFIGRNEYLDRTASILEKSHANPAVVVLTGAGGEGKTQIGLEFCRRSTSTYNAIFWIDASAEVCVVRGLERLALACMPHLLSLPKEKQIAAIKDALRDWRVPWLLVFDNYDDPDTFDISPYFPRAACRNRNAILVLSRRRSCARLGSAIEVSGLTEAEGIDLLQSHRPGEPFMPEDFKESKRIVNRLGCLALAIDQAGAYIFGRSLPLSHFNEHFKRRRLQILVDNQDSIQEYQKTKKSCTRSGDLNIDILTTWELSLQQMSQDVAEQRDLEDFLSQAAFFDPTNVKESLFQMGFEERQHKAPFSWTSLFSRDGVWDSDLFKDTLARLKNRHLIQAMKINLEECRFVLHPMIKEWLQLRVSPEARKSFTHSAILMTASLVRSSNFEIMSLDTRQGIVGTIDCCISNAGYHLQNPDDRLMHGGIMEGFQTTFAAFYARNKRYCDSERISREIIDCAARSERQRIPALVVAKTVTNLAAFHVQKGEFAKALTIPLTALVALSRSCTKIQYSLLLILSGVLGYSLYVRWNRSE